MHGARNQRERDNGDQGEERQQLPYVLPLPWVALYTNSPASVSDNELLHAVEERRDHAVAPLRIVSFIRFSTENGCGALLPDAQRDQRDPAYITKTILKISITRGIRSRQINDHR
ncbi:MAG: hypothetical protein ACLSFJ_02295 [Holdemania filiformis]